MTRRLVLAVLLLVSCSARTQNQPKRAALIIYPSKAAFAPQPLNSQSQPVTITVSNGSTAPVSMQEILASGIDFPSQNDCGNQLAPGAQCQVLIFFKPVISGDRNGILQITASDSPESHFVPLTGIGMDQ